MKKQQNPLRPFILLALLASMLLAACGAPATAQEEIATPTPLPPAPELERPTYEVVRGVIEETLDLNGRISPVDLVRLSFQRQGRVVAVNVQRGDTVEAGQVLAELQQDEELDTLRRAENGVTQAQRSLENAQQRITKSVEQAEQALQNAQSDMERLMPGGADDPIRTAQRELEQAQRAAQQGRNTASESKTSAEQALETATEGLQDKQRAYSAAYWDWDHVQRYGTDPKQPFIPDVNGVLVPNKITEAQKEEYREALVTAERGIRDAEREIQTAQRNLEKAREDEVFAVQDEDEKVVEAQEKLDQLLSGEGNEEIRTARRAVETAQLELEEQRAETTEDEINAIEDAQAELEKARRAVENGRVIAPQAGEVIAISISEGDEATAFEPIIEIADPTNLEVGAELSGEQMRQLSEGQPVEISLLSRPDVIMPGTIRQMPAPYGSGGSGAVQGQDRRTLFDVTDTRGQELVAGNVARIRIVLQRKEDVLLLPPEAIRSFEGNRFVVVRDGDRERRVPVRIGIQNEEFVEILEDAGTTTESLKEGDIIVGR